MTATPEITLIGSGCASLSLAKELARHNVARAKIVTDKSYQDRPDHIWGFWQMPWLDDAVSQATHSWKQWHIITDNMTVSHKSDEHPYCSLHAGKWLGYCADISGAKEVIEEVTDTPPAPYFDSRPVPADEGIFYQHFIGHHIKADRDVFNPDVAILMDFRCDQSQGLHFMYLLPTSANEALVESTLFSEQLLDKTYYETAIKSYLATHYDLSSYEVSHVETGAIPLADCRDRSAPHHAIGARGGALRPSSGYAFSFIQKQVAGILSHHARTGDWQAISPLAPRDLWMDKVFMAVLQARPELSISIFEAIAKSLDGSEFARFMSGNASLATILKMMLSMPKWPFIKAALSPRTYRRGM